MVGPHIHSCASCGEIHQRSYVTPSLPTPAEVARQRAREEKRAVAAGEVSTLADCADPIERFVRAVVACSVNRHGATVSIGGRPVDEYDAEPVLVYTRELGTLFPGSFRYSSDHRLSQRESDGSTRTEWRPSDPFEPSRDAFDWGFTRPEELSSTKIAAWFAEQAREQDLEQHPFDWHDPEKTMFGRPAKAGPRQPDGYVQLRGWGASRVERGWPIGMRDKHVAAIREDGALYTGNWKQAEDGRIEPAGGLYLRAIFIIGLLLGYEPADPKLDSNPYSFRYGM